MSDHAINNAKAWDETIQGYLTAMDSDSWERLEELRDERDAFDPDSPMDPDDAEGLAKNAEELRDLEKALSDFEDEDDARKQAEESVLSVEVRSDRSTPGEPLEPAEFCILLSTGGPALRIVGDLDRGQPSRARMEWQDWGTPWTDYPADADLDEFANIFYFGE